MKLIRSSKHSVAQANTGKLEVLDEFLIEYRRVAQLVVDHLWEYGCVVGKFEFNVKRNQYSVPSFLPVSALPRIETTLTGRALKCCTTQCCAMLKAAVEKQRKRIYILDKKKEDGTPKRRLKSLIRKIKQNIPVKPDCSNLQAELNSLCADLQDGEHFDQFLRLRSIFKDKREVRLPIKFHRKANQLKKDSQKMLPSLLVSNSYVNLRWELVPPEVRTEGIIVGADQGYKDVLNVANATVSLKTPTTCNHGHSLESVVGKVSRKRKGSKAFRRAKDHQKNFVNWSINQLNLSGIKQVNLEKIWNIGHRTKTSRKLSHWQNTLIRDKVQNVCEANGVHFVEQACTYMSQRCFECGNVRKANRKGKLYECKNCGNIDDADQNAAKNHSIELPEIPYTLRKLNLNRGKGFLWKSDGFYDLEGRSLQSLPQVEE